MYQIKVTKGEYAGRVFAVAAVSTDELRVQVHIGRRIEEFKLGLDAVWVRYA